VLRQRGSQLQKYKSAHYQCSKTHSTLRKGSSQLQKHQTAPMSRQIAVERRRYAAVGMAETKGWQFETSETAQELRMRINKT